MHIVGVTLMYMESDSVPCNILAAMGEVCLQAFCQKVFRKSVTQYKEGQSKDKSEGFVDFLELLFQFLVLVWLGVERDHGLG